MKLRFFVLLSLVVLCGYGVAGAQMVSLDHTDGLIDPTHVNTGVPVTFYIRITGDGSNHGGITNGFRVYSNDGATWGTTVGDTLGTLGKAQFDGGFFISHFSADGAGADTVGFGAFRFFSTGLPAGFNNVAYSVEIGPLAEADNGKTICIDSSFYPPSGVWKWAGPDVYPGWSGGQCFTIGPPAACEVAVTSPAGGAVWTAGTNKSITWTTTDCAECGTVDISYSVDGGGFTNIVTATANDGQYTWLVPNTPSTNVVVKVCCSGTSDCGESGVFTIEAPPLPEIVSVDPNSAAQCDEGLVVTITGANTSWHAIMGSDIVNPSVYLTHSSGAPTINAGSVQVVSTTEVHATFSFAYDTPTGLYDVTVDDPTAPPDVLEDGFTVNAAAPANIVVDPSTLIFDAEQYGPNPDDQGFSIHSASCAHDFAVSDDADWLALSVADGTTPVDVIVSVDIDGLLPGLHTATITVEAPLASNSPQTIDVELNITEGPMPGGALFSASLGASGAGGAADMLTYFGLDSNATDGYDPGTDQFEPPIPPGDYIRTYFDHPEYGQIQDEFNSDIRFPFGTSCKDFVLTVETNLVEEITLDLGSILNEGCYTVALYNDLGELLVSNFLADSYTYGTYPGQTDFIIRVCAGEGSVPVITCVNPEPIVICDHGQVCVPLAITGADMVTANGATWAAGQLCFDVASSNAYNFRVIATSNCGADTCDILVNVTVMDLPVIDCPQDPIVVMIAPGETCVPLAITGATGVTVEAGDWTASWVDGQFCFDAGTVGEYAATVSAANDCGSVDCPITVVVQDCPLPVVDCPDGPMNFNLCELGPISFPMAVTGADSVQVSAGSWVADEFSFTPGGFGTFPFTLTATNACGSVDCPFTVNVTQIPMPVITCPEGVFQYALCAVEEICIDLPIANADSVLIDGNANWADGQLCFTAEPGMNYSFVVHASNACGEDVCTVEFNIGSYTRPTACFTADPTEGPVPLEVTFTNCSVVDPALTPTYFWDFDDGSMSMGMNPAHTFDQIGCYDVTLTVTDACGNHDFVTHTICVSDSQVVQPTDRWINIYCPEPMLEGVPLEPGDFISAYDPDGILCGMGQVEADGSYGMILIYADDIYTADVDEGADVGDLISIKINGVPVATDPPIIWTENGAVFMVCNFTAETCMTFDLDAGWHLISWNVAYSDDIAAMLADFVECVDVVLSFDRGGLTYDPTLPQFSTLMDVDFYHGYWLRLSCPVTFEICGGIISPNDGIQVYSGWNLAGYWPDEVLPVEDGFASLLADDNLLVAYGYDNGAMDYIPGDLMHQSLTELMPGYGYWVKVKWNALLAYPGFNPPVAPRVDNRGSLVASSGVTPSRNWMSIYGSDLQIDSEPVRSGATVEIFSDDGVLCGSGVFNDGILKFTSVYGYDGDNETTAQYPKSGEPLNVRIDGVGVAAELTFRGDGSRVSLGSLSTATLLPGSYSMSQNYPNPFNPSTNVSFSLPTAGQVELSVYNVLGQKVATIANGQFTAGTHEVTWNGTDDSGSSVGSGIYFYRLTSDGFDETKKMILMK